jgi:osmoprotectant transport system permease protein
MDTLVIRTLLRDVGRLLLEHIWIVFVAASLATAIGVSLGIASTRNRSIRRYAIAFANVMQTIPSLAMFGFLLPVPIIGGIGKRTAILSLILYGLLPVLRNTITGIAGVDPAVRESAKAMGMTDGQLLFNVELPLAASTILAGIRTTLVATIGTATIAAAIGAGGLGVLIFRGLASVDTVEILAGALPAAALALLADGGMALLERRWQVSR